MPVSYHSYPSLASHRYYSSNTFGAKHRGIGVKVVPAEPYLRALTGEVEGVEEEEEGREAHSFGNEVGGVVLVSVGMGGL